VTWRGKWGGKEGDAIWCAGVGDLVGTRSRVLEAQRGARHAERVFFSSLN
jgi:hypothetical protein